MESMRVASQRVIYAVAIFILAIALILPAIASAAQVSERSVALSSSSAGASDVTYAVTFTPVANAGAFTLDFCANSPLIGITCTAPTGFTAAGAATASAGFTVNGTPTASHVVVAGSMTGGTPVTVELTGIDNPTDVGTIYARVVTYVDASATTAVTPTAIGDAIDQGGVAIAITDTIGVTGQVLETLTFCVSGAEMDAACAGATSTALPLGEDLGNGVVALQPGVISTGDIYTQITTNAAGGAIVHLKSSAEQCGGMLRVGDTPSSSTCYVQPADAVNGIDDTGNTARFGVKTAAASTAANDATNSIGDLTPVSPYGAGDDTAYRMQFASNEETGVTSPFGDPFLTTGNAPASNRNQVLTFGAMADNNTPAGTYVANISLIAVGKF